MNEELNKKLAERMQQFEEKMKGLFANFASKNRHYGDNYFTEEYSPQERWMSVKRKVARLSAHYQQGVESHMPDETLEDTWSDLAIYAVMELIHMDLDKEKKQ